MPIESTNESALTPNVAMVTKPLIHSIARAQDHLVQEFHFHLLNELLSHRFSNDIYYTTQTDVLLSPKIEVTDIRRQETEQLIYALHLFAPLHSSHTCSRTAHGRTSPVPNFTSSSPSIHNRSPL